MNDMAASSKYRKTGWWLRGLALAVDIAVIVLWVHYDEMPVVSHFQRKLFILTVPGSTTILLVLTVLALLEPPGDLALRIFLLTTSCLFTITGVIFLINYLAFNTFHGVARTMALLVLFNSVLLTIDLLTLDCVVPLETPQNDSDEPTLEVIEPKEVVD